MYDPQVSMDWALMLLLPVMFHPSLSVLFTVEVERTRYESEFGGDVVMGCSFQPKPPNPHDNLKVTWHWRSSPRSNVVREVHRIDNMKEHLASQDPNYRGRVRLLTEELKEGWAKLQVSRLRINDSGTYQCVVQTREGADYKAMTLSVTAPYKAVTKKIQKAAGEDEVLLTCQSEGYPNSSVTWQDGQLRRINPNTTAVSTQDQLFRITSEIRVRSSEKNNYTCSISIDSSSGTFNIPDEIPVAPVKNNAPIVVLSIVVIMVVIIAATVFAYCRRKGSRAHSTRNLLIDDKGRPVSPTECLPVNKENEDGMPVFHEGSKKENLREFVKDHYFHVFFSENGRGPLMAYAMQELPQRLQNNKGQPVDLQALLPEAGEILLLEGPPGSGKTTTAHVLVSFWTKGPTHNFQDHNVPDLSSLQLLLYVDCSKVKGDLFQEVRTQLSLTKKILMEDELRTVLTRSNEALLLLDGYREGNQVFDDSLKTFLSERGGCRVLVMACPGHCPMIKDTVGTGGVVKLQTQTTRY